MSPSSLAISCVRSPPVILRTGLGDVGQARAGPGADVRVNRLLLHRRHGIVDVRLHQSVTRDRLQLLLFFARNFVPATPSVRFGSYIRKRKES